MPRVSVVLPVYNGEKYLREALDSVLKQDYPDWEVIIIDDGSTDGTGVVARDYLQKDPFRIRYCRQENQGVSVARNRGIREAQGEFVAFIDADDVWLPQKMARAVACLDNRPDWGMVFHDLYVVKMSGQFMYRWFEKKKQVAEGRIYKNLLRENFILPSATVVRKKVLETTGVFDTGIRNVEDVDLWLRIARDHAIGMIPEVLSQWRRHEGNASSNGRINLENSVLVFEKQLAVNKKGTQYVRLLRECLFSIYVDLVDACWLQRDVRFARRYSLRALKYGCRVKVLMYLLLPPALVLAVKFRRR